MKTLTKELWMNVPAGGPLSRSNAMWKALSPKAAFRKAWCLVNAMHITASVFINDDEPGLHHDYEKWLEELAPFDPSPERYHHNRTGEDNADAHHKRQIMGREVVVADHRGQTRTSARGSTSSTTNSTAAAKNACW